MDYSEIDNHILANTKDAPWNRSDDKRQRESCLICNKTMILDGEMGWCDDNENYLRESAGECLSGYVCGTSCRSQAMFNALGPSQQAALKLILGSTAELQNALKTLGTFSPKRTRYSSVLSPFVNADSFNNLCYALHECEALLLGDQDEDSPEWTKGCQSNIGQG